MSQMFLNPTSLLRSTIEIVFEGEVTPAYVQAASEEHLEVIVNPGEGDEEFYAELYLEDYRKSWYLVEANS